MERKTILELAFVIFPLALIVILPLKVCFTETDLNVKLLAVGIILSVLLGGYNMLKLFRRDREIELKEQEIAQRDRQIAQKDVEIELLKKKVDIEEERRKEERSKEPW